MTQSNPIRVMLVDDHAVVRSGLRAFLPAFDDLELAGEAGGGEEAVRLCEQVQPNVVLMDLVMPGMDDATATRAIRAACAGRSTLDPEAVQSLIRPKFHISNILSKLGVAIHTEAVALVSRHNLVP